MNPTPVVLTDQERETVNANISLIYFVAARYRGIGPSTFEDLVGRMYHRLCLCIAHYDPSLGFKLSPYVVRSLEGEAKNFFRDEVWTVRPPRKLRENWSREVAQGDALGDDHLAGESRDTIESCARPISLDALVERPEGADSAPEWAESTVDVEAEVIARIGGAQVVKLLFEWLHPEERYVLALMMRGKPLTLLQERFRLTAPQARAVWRELQEKLKTVWFQLIEGEPLLPSEGSQALGRILRRRFVPPASGVIAVRQAYHEERTA